jgi:hypothetical protein
MLAWLWLSCRAETGTHTGTDSGVQTAEVALNNVGTACVFGDEVLDVALTPFTADAPITAQVTLDECASTCATDVVATCGVGLFGGEVVVTASATYSQPVGVTCPADCREVVATCEGPGMYEGYWTVDYGGGHSDGFTVPGSVAPPCATAR